MNHKPIIIGCLGVKHSGKDEIHKAIASAIKGTQRIAFADALKREVCRACNITLEELNAKKELYRPILQWWGSEFRRNNYGSDYWIKKALKTFHGLRALNGTHAVVFTDVRFQNEAEIIHLMGGHLWRVIRPSLGTNSDTHASEVEQEGIKEDQLIVNDGTLEQLHNQVVCRYLAVIKPDPALYRAKVVAQ